MTPEEADKAYDEAPAIPISDNEVERLVKYATSHKWLPWLDECPDCGNGENAVYTVSNRGAYDGDSVKCSNCGQTGYVSADEEGCHTVWNELELPELTQEERKVMDAIPKDAVSHWCNGEIWDGEKWVSQSVSSELDKLLEDHVWQKKKQRNIRNAETWR